MAVTGARAGLHPGEAIVHGRGPLVGEPLRRVLLVEDGAADRRLITELLVDAGLERADVVTSGSLAGARHQLAQTSVDCVLLDLTLPDATGLDGVRVLSGALPGVPLVIVSGQPPDTVAYAAMAEGADEFLCKHDLTAEALADALRRAEQRRRGNARAKAQLASTNLALEALEVPAVAIDGSGVVVATNHAWLQAALAGGASPSRTGVGANYLTVCDLAVGDDAGVAAEVAEG
ncbi:MAG TPA: response regulator, partial [Acidimicrobiales bacterium]|nr:response regulator [Acidimicrobiales bacterium]